MAKYTAKKALYDGKEFTNPGDPVEIKSAEEAKRLIASGDIEEISSTKAVKDPKSDDELLEEEELGKLKVDDLKRLCELLEIDGSAGLNKPDLITLIELHSEEESDDED